MPSALLVADGKGTSTLSPHASLFTTSADGGRGDLEGSLGRGGAPLQLTADTLSAALLAQQLPAISKFSGDNVDGDGETFSESLEQLELVAEVCGWNRCTKLVNVVTRLRGSAYRLYCSCSPEQRASYQSLTKALKTHFTPVKIQSVQSSHFHEWRQLPSETVDHYAQDLRRLFCQAYTPVQRESQAAEEMAKSVLAY